MFHSLSRWFCSLTLFYFAHFPTVWVNFFWAIFEWYFCIQFSIFDKFFFIIHRLHERDCWCGAHAWQLEKHNHGSMEYKLSRVRVLIMSFVCFSFPVSCFDVVRFFSVHSRFLFYSEYKYGSHLSNIVYGLPHSIFFFKTKHDQTQYISVKKKFKSHARIELYNCRFDLIQLNYLFLKFNSRNIFSAFYSSLI